jgi:hypothetical protein
VALRLLGMVEALKTHEQECVGRCCKPAVKQRGGQIRERRIRAISGLQPQSQAIAANLRRA